MVIALLMVGCSAIDPVKSDIKMYRSSMCDINIKEWYAPAVVEFEVDDTTSIFEVRLAVRHASYDYADSLQLNITTTSPDSTVWSEPFTLYLQGAEPKRNRKQLTEVDYRHKVVWQQRGRYKIEFYPHSIYSGIEAIGVNIIPYQPNK